MAEAPVGAAKVIGDWLSRQLDPEARAWLEAALARRRQAASAAST
jgi:hypothetical protein